MELSIDLDKQWKTLVLGIQMLVLS